MDTTRDGMNIKTKYVDSQEHNLVSLVWHQEKTKETRKLTFGPLVF